MHDISYIDPSLKKTLNKEISIQISLNGFSFYIKDERSKELAFRHYSFKGIFLTDELIRKTSEILDEDTTLHADFTQTQVIYVSQKSTLIPSDYFEPQSAKKAFEFNQTIEELDEIHYTHLPFINSYNIYTIPNYLANELSKKFNNKVQFNHQGSKLLALSYKIHAKNPGLKLFVNINKGFFDFAIFSENNLKLYNSYQYVHQTDFIYFLLYACKELKLDAHNEKFVFMGEHSDNDVLFTEVQKYLGEIIMLNDIAGAEATHGKMNYQQFYSLS